MLLRVQGCEYVRLVRFGDHAELAEHPFSLSGQGEFVVAAVGFAAGAFDEAAGLQIVDEGD